MPSVLADIPEYTNCIVNMLWADGSNNTKAVLYSHNPAFDLQVVTNAEASNARGKQSRVAKAKEQLAHLRTVMAEYGIAEDRIVYIESETGSKYCAESADVYRHFIKKYKSRLNHANVAIIRDAGRSFTPGGVSLFQSMTTSLGYECVLPPMLHHFHSPCDNKHHGVVKSKWRTLRSHGDDVVSSLFLLQQLDQVPGDHIKGWFATNFCFDTQDKSEAVLTKALEKLYFGKQAVMHEYHDDCLEAYYARFPAEQVAAEALPARAPTKGYVVTRTA